MIPILYGQNESNFETNGIGSLVDAISCTVEESRNGIYELTMRYPISGRMFNEIQLKRIILARHCDATDLQPFRIYAISKPINGIVTIMASHISYDLTKIVLKPFEAETIVEAFQKIPYNTIYNCPFSFWTDKSTVAHFEVSDPSSVRSILGGVEGSILDTFGTGEYEWDWFDVKFHGARGTNSGITIRYGKNLSNLTHTVDSFNQYNGIAPFWRMEDESVTLPEWAIFDAAAAASVVEYTNEGNIAYDNGTDNYDGLTQNIEIVPVDFSQKFASKPTVAQLRSAAVSYLANEAQKVPKENILISFVQLWQTEEYKDFAPLQRVRLCDIVNVIYTELGVNVSAKVIRVVYNTLLEMYDEMELGEPRATMASTLAKQNSDIQSLSSVVKKAVTETDLTAAIEHATSMITGAEGGYVVLATDATTGYPKELLIMDSPDKSQAVNVWRWNSGGLGHSSNGYNGPFSDIALTADGKINASMITTGSMSAARITSGTMSAARILGGTLKIGGVSGGTGGNGVIDIYNSSDVRVGRWNASGLKIGENNEFQVNMAGKVTATNAVITGKVTTDDLMATGGRIGNWRIAANYLGAWQSAQSGVSMTQYQVRLESQENITGSDWVFSARHRSWNGTSYGSWNVTTVIQYDGKMLLSAPPESGDCVGTTYNSKTTGTVLRRFEFDRARIVLYRDETVSGTTTSFWTGFIDCGVYSRIESGSTYRYTRYMALCTYPTNIIGFAVTQTGSTQTALTSAKNLVFWYDGTYKSNDNSTGVMVCNRDLRMQTMNIVNAGTVNATAFRDISGTGAHGFAVVGKTKQVSNSDAFYQMAYQNGTTFFFLNDSQISSVTPSSSDSRMKKEIKDINNDLIERIGNVKLKQFRYRKNTIFDESIHYGAIAQDVQEAIGDIDSSMVYSSMDTDMLNLNYTELLVLKIAYLEKKIKSLEERIFSNEQ